MKRRTKRRRRNGASKAPTTYVKFGNYHGFRTGFTYKGGAKPWYGMRKGKTIRASSLNELWNKIDRLRKR